MRDTGLVRAGVEIYAESPADIFHAYSVYYSRLADFFAGLIPQKPRVLLEAGCGRGQLTIPLIRNLDKTTRLICVDSSRGPYVGWMDDFARKVGRLKLGERIRLVKTDVRKMDAVGSGSVDALVSNELICDLTRPNQLGRALKEFYRVLRTGGLMIHGEWSSWQEGRSRGLTVKHSPAWNLDRLFTLLAQNGFHDNRAYYFDTTIRFGHDAAIEELRTWGAAAKLVEKRILAGQESIRLPFEHIVVSEK
jgi:ubiquinone/menaquinone biosynthesis C-methylase UbiE